VKLLAKEEQLVKLLAKNAKLVAGNWKLKTDL
jgi:hypothetical protein